VTLGDIARIRAAKGEVDAALQLHQERLGVYEALGDKRERAVTLGDIARIRAAKGEVDAALQLHQERLGIFEALGDLDGKANTLWSIAQIEIQQEKWQEAFNHFSESYAINLKLGRLDGICMVGLDLGQLLCMAGNRDEGLKILTRSRDGFTKLGQTQMAQQTQALMEQISKLPPPQPE
jgi:tetratricopeptide (TPR) repeat protein